VANAFAAAGWWVIPLALTHFGPLALDMLGWRVLFRPAHRLPLGRLLVYRWIGESINNLLPVAQVGGDVARARLAAKAGAFRSESAAATAVDFTMGLLAEMLVALATLALLAARTGLVAGLHWVLLGILGLTVLVGAFVAAQANGMLGKFGRRVSRVWTRVTHHSAAGLADKADRLDDAIGAIYRRPRAVLACITWRLASWAAGAIEILLALYLLGEPVGFMTALILHGLTMAIRSVAFLIPAGLGVQEGGFALVGRLLGLAGPTAVALALIRRVRELLLGLGGLFVWWLIETRRGSQDGKARRIDCHCG
jgi:putative membrane protein